MRVLLTGATGFIGQHLVVTLLQKGHDVVALSRNIDKAKTFSWYKQVKFISYDVHSLDMPNKNIFANIDAVLHTAWHGLPNYNSLFHFEKNLYADYKFIKKLLENGIQQVLVTGTCFEYGMKSGQLNERMLTQPENSYALAKDTLRCFLEQLQTKMPFTLQWTRLFYMYGKGQNPNSLLAQLDQAIANKNTVFRMSAGEQLRDYLAVEQVAANLVDLLECKQADGVFNICSGKPVSIRNLVEQYLQQKQVTMSLDLGYYPYSKYEPMAFWGSNAKINRLLAGS
ncbi:MAG: NAD(P)-dependent oxidoreductase [Mariprofundales bacterium]